MASQKIGSKGITDRFARGGRSLPMILEQSVAQFDQNYLIAKEFAGIPRAAHHATARGAMDELGYESFVPRYRTLVFYTTMALDWTLNILPKHSIPTSSGL